MRLKFLAQGNKGAPTGARTHDWQASTYYESDAQSTAPRRPYQDCLHHDDISDSAMTSHNVCHTVSSCITVTYYFRDLPRAVYSGLFFVMSVYTLTTAAYYVVLSKAEVLGSTSTALVSIKHLI